MMHGLAKPKHEDKWGSGVGVLLMFHLRSRQDVSLPLVSDRFIPGEKTPVPRVNEAEWASERI
jgi:hypothetical protein